MCHLNTTKLFWGLVLHQIYHRNWKKRHLKHGPRSPRGTYRVEQFNFSKLLAFQVVNFISQQAIEIQNCSFVCHNNKKNQELIEDLYPAQLQKLRRITLRATERCPFSIFSCLPPWSRAQQMGPRHPFWQMCRPSIVCCWGQVRSPSSRQRRLRFSAALLRAARARASRAGLHIFSSSTTRWPVCLPCSLFLLFPFEREKPGAPNDDY